MITATIHIDVPKNLLMKANGGQGQVYANAQRAKHLRHTGATIGRDWINQHQPWTPYGRVDVEYEIHYPRKPSRADPEPSHPPSNTSSTASPTRDCGPTTTTSIYDDAPTPWGHPPEKPDYGGSASTSHH